jgi:Tol biopolymer transport system component
MLIAYALAGCGDRSAVSSVRVMPERELGQGIYQLDTPDAIAPLTWSPKDDILLGLAGTSPYPPMPDCLVCFPISAPKFNSEIFLIDVGTARRYRVLQTPTNGGKVLSDVYWFPDGRHVAYLVPGYVNRTEDSGTWSVDINGDGDEHVHPEVLRVAWAPDGSKFLVEREGSIFESAGFGTGEVELYHPPFPGGQMRGISWSADGKRIAFSYGDTGADKPEQRPKIYFLEAVTGQVSQMPGDSYEHFTMPVLSPTSDIMIFKRYQPQFYRDSTVIMDLRSACQTELPVSTIWPASWSPDGSKVLLSRAGEYYIVDLKELFGADFQEAGAICQ